ncbi:MAG: hypothetical protein JWR26_3132 [Pedosphaera sp.]|nr:hypothetical protein [Pedosphaera sp.]
MCSLMAQLQSRGVEETIIAASSEGDRWPGSSKSTAYELLPQNKPARWIRFNRVMRSAAALYVIGADVIDGAYGIEPALAMLSAAHFGAQRGLRSTVVGCSCNETPDPRIVEYLRRMDSRVAVLARDCYSRDRFANAMGRPVRLVADIAFLLKPASAGESRAVALVQEWVSQRQRANRGLIIGCNLNPQPLIFGGRDPADLLSAYVETFRQLRESLGSSFSLLILPHDYRPQHQELEICQAFHKLLPEDLKANTLLLGDPLNAAEVKAIAGCCDVVLTGRMHMAIAALGSGKPAICLSYLSKFEGLLAYFGLEELALTWQEAIAPGRMAAWANQIILRQNEYKARVETKLPEVMKLALGNLEFNSSKKNT